MTMAAPKRATHVVVKDGLYFTTNPETGVLEKSPVDTQLTLTSEQAEKLEKRGFVKSLKDAKTVDVSDVDSKALKKAKDDLKASNDKLKEAEDDLKASNDKLKKAQDDLEAANK